MTICRPLALAALLSAIAVTATAQPTTAPAATPSADPLASLAWTLGDWRLDAKWANGNPLRATANYASIVGGKFIAVTTMVEPNDGAAAFNRDLAVYGLQDGRLTQWTFAQDGSARVVPATPTEDGSLYFEWTKPAAGMSPALPLRLRISRDGDALRWQQSTQLKGEWHSTLDGRFVRQPAVSTTRPADTGR